LQRGAGPRMRERHHTLGSAGDVLGLILRLEDLAEDHEASAAELPRQRPFLDNVADLCRRAACEIATRLLSRRGAA
jgi:hypothetical protein